jgi:hypothetical protein
LAAANTLGALAGRGRAHLMPRFLAYSSEVMREAEAPSVRNDEEAAVTDLKNHLAVGI